MGKTNLSTNLAAIVTGEKTDKKSVNVTFLILLQGIVVLFQEHKMMEGAWLCREK